MMAGNIKEKEKGERQKKTTKVRERERESVCVCVCVWRFLMSDSGPGMNHEDLGIQTYHPAHSTNRPIDHHHDKRERYKVSVQGRAWKRKEGPLVNIYF